MKPFLTLSVVLAPCMVPAHPHVFVETGLKVIVTQDAQLQAIEVTWVYDDFYSLLILEDMGLDPDFDGALTARELDKLQGFDLQWSDGFDGDVYMTRHGAALALGGGEHLMTEVSDGRITTRHRRTLIDPVAADGVVFRAYDPTYYTAYTLTRGLEVTGGCTGVVTPPDLNAAYDKVEELLYAVPVEQAEQAYPEIGEAFADTVRLKCDA